MATQVDVIILGAGAAGLFCASQTAYRGRSTVVLDHAKRIGGKILMSGGGRCNFTNMYAEPGNYLSNNPHFCKSALAQYTQWDFIDLVNRHGIAYHEKTLGQLFCDESAKDILNMLLDECQQAGATIQSQCQVQGVAYIDERYHLQTSIGDYVCSSLIVATGGLSMPKLGASGFGYQLAEQFGMAVLPTRAGLVPFTLQPDDKAIFAELSGVSVSTHIDNARQGFTEKMLFTHRGLSGPAILQISNYWFPGESVSIDLCQGLMLEEILTTARENQANVLLSNVLSAHFAKRLLTVLLAYFKIDNKPMKQYQQTELAYIVASFTAWQLAPNGTEGYRTAEVTLGGVDTDGLSSKTMMSKTQPNLFFIGEVVDVTGWLGGYNFQWAWSSGYVAAQHA